METCKNERKHLFKKTGICFLLAITHLVLQTNLAWSFANSFGFTEHQKITHIALKPEGPDSFEAVLSNGSFIPFKINAIEEIVISNVASDNRTNQLDKKRHFDNEFLVIGSLFLIEVKNKIIAEITKAEPDGKFARELLGQASHAVQDYYSHTNWLEINGPGVINMGLGRQRHGAASQGSTCNEDSNVLAGDGLSSLTSGYWDAPRCDPVTKSGQNKCIHGGPIPFIADCEGINKDRSIQPGFFEAKALAVEATKDYVQQILTAVAGNDDAIRVLLDQPAILSFKILMSGFNAVGNTFPASETLHPFGPVNISNSLSPSTGILIAAGDSAVAGTPGDTNYTGDLIFSSSAGSPIFVTSQRLGSMIYDSDLQGWKISFPSDTDLSGITALKAAVHLTYIFRTYEGEATAGYPAEDCDSRVKQTFVIPLPISDTQQVAGFTNLIRVVVPPASNPCLNP